MRFKTEVIEIRELPKGTKLSYSGLYTLPHDAKIAVIPLGYADGYSRALTNLAEVLIGGRFYKMRGRVTMDFCLLELDKDDDEVKVGDEVVLWGKQDDEEINLTELASMVDAICYEFTCNVDTVRVPRSYIN